ncbi:hypothetical protein M91_06864, partial [Bos mutus]
ESLNRGGGWRGERDRTLAHHVFLALIEPNLTEREASEEEVKARRDETVVADLLVKVVYVLGAIPRAPQALSSPVVARQSPHQHDHSPGAEDDATGGQLGPTAQKRRHEERSRGWPRYGPGRKSVRGRP